MDQEDFFCSGNFRRCDQKSQGVYIVKPQGILGRPFFMKSPFNLSNIYRIYRPSNNYLYLISSSKKIKDFQRDYDLRYKYAFPVEIIKSKKFKLNKFLTLKLERGETVIYINKEKFIICMHLILNIHKKDINLYDQIDSVDEAAEIYKKFKGEQSDHSISPEQEFKGHCSNLQVWFENDYDSRLLHRNLAFPLLRKLSQVGDSLAKKAYKDEVFRRFSTGYLPTQEFLINENYLMDLNEEEINVLLEYLNLDLIQELKLIRRLSLYIALKKVKLRTTFKKKVLDLLKNAIYESFQSNNIECINFILIKKEFDKVLKNIFNLIWLKDYSNQFGLRDIFLKNLNYDIVIKKGFKSESLLIFLLNYKSDDINNSLIRNIVLNLRKNNTGALEAFHILTSKFPKYYIFKLIKEILQKVDLTAYRFYSKDYDEDKWKFVHSIFYLIKNKFKKNPVLMQLFKNALRSFKTGFVLIRNGLHFVDKNNGLQHSHTKLTRINEIIGLHHYKDLRIFSGHSNKILDLTGIEVLDNLEELVLNHNQIKNIMPLKFLKNLKYLDLSYNEIENIKPLIILENLEHLDLSYNNIKNIDLLGNLKNLKFLNVEGNPIKKISNRSFFYNLPAFYWG